jgi:hypothetical protein
MHIPTWSGGSRRFSPTRNPSTKGTTDFGVSSRPSPRRGRRTGSRSSAIDERPGQILVQLKFIGKAHDGLEVDQTFHQIYRYDSDNMLVEFLGFTDEDEARREAGLTDG